MNKKVIVRQPFKIEYEQDIDEDLYQLNHDELYGMLDIDETKIEQELVNYINTYPWEDEYRDLFNTIKEVKLSFDWDKDIIIAEFDLDTELDDNTLKEDLRDILSDVFDGEITGSFILDIDSIESEPYESDYNPMTDEIIYDTSEIDEINIDWELTFDELAEVLIENNQLTESTQTSYNITYFLNSATANREPSTEDQVKRDWKEITKTFKNDLSAFEYIVTDILEDDLEDIYDEYDITKFDDDDIKISAILRYFQDQDIGSGETIIIKIEGNYDYDSGYEIEDFLDEVETDDVIDAEDDEDDEFDTDLYEPYDTKASYVKINSKQVQPFRIEPYYKRDLHIFTEGDVDINNVLEACLELNTTSTSVYLDDYSVKTYIHKLIPVIINCKNEKTNQTSSPNIYCNRLDNIYHLDEFDKVNDDIKLEINSKLKSKTTKSDLETLNIKFEPSIYLPEIYVTINQDNFKQRLIQVKNYIDMIYDLIKTTIN